MKKLKIQIPDMQSSHCQMRVNSAINTVNGATVESIHPGVADITVQDEAQQSEVLAAIEKAGYKVSATEDAASNAGKTFTFKTDINCSACVAKVAPALDSAEGVCHWDMDIKGRDKILSVHSDGISPEEIMDTVRKAGFSIESIQP